MKKNIEKFISISLEKARSYYKKSNDEAFKSMLEENFGKENLTCITWKSLKEIDGYHIDTSSDIIYTPSNITSSINRNIFTTKNQAKSCLAMAQLSHLIHYYNHGWVPDWNNRDEAKYCILWYTFEKKPFITSLNYSKQFICFRTKEVALRFMHDNIELIEEYYNF